MAQDEEIIEDEGVVADETADELGDVGAEDVGAVEEDILPAEMITLTRDQVPELEGLTEGDPIKIMMEATVGAVNENGSFDLNPVSFAVEDTGALPGEEGELPPEGEEDVGGLADALTTEPAEQPLV